MWPFSRRKGSSGFSSSSTAEEVTQGIDGTNLTAIVTGASSGIGTETTRVLALRGVHVVMAVRNMAAGIDAKESIVKEIPNAKLDAMGAATTCYVALHPQLKGVSGEYFVDSNISKASSKGRDMDLAKKLWDFSLNLTR